MILARDINLYSYKELRSKVRFNSSEIMSDAWWYFRQGNITFSQALKKAWAWAKSWVSECREQLAKYEALDAKLRANYEERKNKIENASDFMDADSVRSFYMSDAYKGD